MTPFETATARLAMRDETKAQTLLEGSNDLFEAVDKYEKGLIFEALRLSNGRVVKAAKILNISYQALCDKLNRKYPELRHKPKALRPRN